MLGGLREEEASGGSARRGSKRSQRPWSRGSVAGSGEGEQQACSCWFKSAGGEASLVAEEWAADVGVVTKSRIAMPKSKTVRWRGKGEIG